MLRQRNAESDEEMDEYDNEQNHQRGVLCLGNRRKRFAADPTKEPQTAEEYFAKVRAERFSNPFGTTVVASVAPRQQEELPPHPWRAPSPIPLAPLPENFVQYCKGSYLQLQSRVTSIRRAGHATPLGEAPTLRGLASLTPAQVIAMLATAGEKADCGIWPYAALCALEEPLHRETEAALYEYYTRVAMLCPESPEKAVMIAVVGYHFGQGPK